MGKIIESLKKDYNEDHKRINGLLLSLVIVLIVMSTVFVPMIYELEDNLLDYEEMNETFQEYNFTQKIDLIRQNEQDIKVVENKLKVKR